MKQLSLQEIKEIELDLLKMFHSFCIENNIKYFISNGTLLGAVRYKGFIPWDDDVDVLVPREDYNKLLSLFQDSKQYCLFSFERNQEFRFPIAKLCNMYTRKEEDNINNGVVLGIDIDIFPLDSWDDDLEKAKQEAKRIKKSMFFLGLTKLYKPDSVNPLKSFIKGIAMIFCKMCGSKYFIQKIIKESNKNYQKGFTYLGCKSWCVYGERDIIPAEVFADVIEIEFEGEKFPAPIGYDTYLRCLYGDYMPEPPKEKQKTHHSFKAYRI